MLWLGAVQERRTPLHDAAGAGSIDVLQALLDAGADKEAKDSVRRAALSSITATLFLAAACHYLGAASLHMWRP